MGTASQKNKSNARKRTHTQQRKRTHTGGFSVTKAYPMKFSLKPYSSYDSAEFPQLLKMACMGTETWLYTCITMPMVFFTLKQT